MPNLCAVCANELPEASTVCAHCGSQVTPPPTAAEAPKPLPTAAEVTAATAGANQSAYDTPAYRVDDSLTGIGGWLILVAINLVLGAFYTVYAILSDLNALYNPRFQLYLNSRHGVATLVLFEAATNTIFLLALVVLNVLFYQRKRVFPKLMIAYLAARLVLIAGDHVVALSMHLHVTSSFTVARAFIYTVIWIPYFINSIRVEQTFTR